MSTHDRSGARIVIPTTGHSCDSRAAGYDAKCGGCLTMAWAEERREFDPFYGLAFVCLWGVNDALLFPESSP